MASILFSDSTSSNKHDNYNYYTPVREYTVARRKLFINEKIINIDSDDNVDNVGQAKNDAYG